MVVNCGQNQNWEAQQGQNQNWELSWQSWYDLERLDEHMGPIVFLGEKNGLESPNLKGCFSKWAGKPKSNIRAGFSIQMGWKAQTLE